MLLLLHYRSPIAFKRSSRAASYATYCNIIVRIQSDQGMSDMENAAQPRKGHNCDIRQNVSQLSHYNLKNYPLSIESVLTPDNVFISLCSFLGRVWEMVCHCLLPWSQREWRIHGVSAGFVANVGIEILVCQFLVWCFNHYTNWLSLKPFRNKKTKCKVF